MGFFSRFSVRSMHRRTRSSADITERPELPGNAIPSSAASASGYEVAVGFKPVEHPIEPLNHDQPVRCPLPEPSILNDGTIWKERMSSGGERARTELPVVKEESQLAFGAVAAKPARFAPRRAILPSISAPEGDIIDLLEEYKASKEQNTESSLEQQ
ncbi:hypothetical protein HPP92_014701 [Vanilla planifolia]|uniref:Cystic fibrosis transmembrane conductance regulator n=1 Tax=Vanilla planifolia TaxID=51239 RepID=A0A835QN60_VANPL|nr:hypothetical protein HPP92_014701 [Vanilla planifolia]